MIIFKASEVVNFAQGSLLLLGAYTIARLSDPLGFWLAALAGIAVTAAAALIIERLVINRLRGAPVSAWPSSPSASTSSCSPS